jgi:hypothetical protein
MRRLGTILVMVWALTGSIASAGILFDAEGDYLAGWTGAQNPNGVWTYGWSTSPGNNFTLYTVPGQIAGFTNFDEWTDPTNLILNTPVVYSNQSGSSYTGGAGLDNLPAGALVLHGGGTAASCGSDGACFSEVIWTAPGAGAYSLDTTFTGRQTGMSGLVEVVKVTGATPSLLFSNTVTDTVSVSFNQTISLLAGDQIIFAARSSSGTLAPDTSQLQAVLQDVPVPEPSSFMLLAGALAGFAALKLRRARA